MINRIAITNFKRHLAFKLMKMIKNRFEFLKVENKKKRMNYP